MSNEPNVRYGFLPFLRSGLITRVNATSLAAATPRSSIPISIVASQDRDDSGPELHTLPGQVFLHGPGDVVGFDPSVLVRTDPKPGVGDFEANYFATADLDPPDFAWRFTPLGPDGNRLRPWICLVALRDDEFTMKIERGKLPSITVERANAALSTMLPDLSESWAWAHVQFTDALDDDTVIDFASAAQLADIVEKHPELAISRLVCPRRLEDNTAYTAFIVPTFEAGRLAGLQMPADQVPGDESAWQQNSTRVVLPVYFQWSFRTGARGDFEYLVRALQPYRIPGHVGLRDVDVGHPGPMVPAISPPAGRATPTLGFQGALQSLDTEPTPWPDPARAQPDPFQVRIRQLLNAEADDPLDDPFVMPPIYGRWHAAVTAVDGSVPQWIESLNVDPRHRGTAGLGTVVIQKDQETLMAEAWRQAGNLDLANDALRYGQLGREITGRIAARHFSTRVDEDYLIATRALHAKVLGSPTTIRHQLASTAIPAAALSPAFARLARPGGRLIRRAAPVRATAGAVVRNLLSRSNLRQLHVAPIKASDGATTVQSLRSASLLNALRWNLSAHLRRLSASPWGIALVLLFIVVLAVVPFGWLIGIGLVVAGAAVLLVNSRRAYQRFARDFSSATIRDAVPSRDFTFSNRQQGWTGAPEPAAGAQPSPELSARHARAFKDAAIAALELARPAVVASPPRPPANVVSIRAKLTEALDPAITIPQMVLADLKFRDTLIRPADPLGSVMDHPKFPQPMYEPLADMSQDLMLPGIGGIPVNTCGLTLTNSPFVESYMVGLNHEMSRELLWREYPTDQRGSYFRQFWDVSARGTLPPEESSEREAIRDIRPIHLWRSGALGQHRPGAGPHEENIVLLVRGDLLKKYPNTVIYAARAGWVQSGDELYRAVPEGAEERTPIFRGELRPDISFIGFTLTEPEVRADPGWFFVLEEQFTQPRFGLDVGNGAAALLTKWSDLSWTHMNVAPGQHVSIAGAPPAVANANVSGGPAWGATSAALAAITLQQPVRIMVHGSQMIPRPQEQGADA